MGKWERAAIGALGVYLTVVLLLTTWHVGTKLPAFVTQSESGCPESPSPSPSPIPTASPSPTQPGVTPSPAASASPASASAPSPTPTISPSPRPSTSPAPSPRALDADERRRLALVLGDPYLLWLLGCLGATVAALWAYVRRIGEQPEGAEALRTQWIPYYLVRPPIGGVVGLVSVLGLDFLQFRPASCTPLLFLAFAAGLASRQATLKLREVALSLFTSSEYLHEQAAKAKKREP